MPAALPRYALVSFTHFARSVKAGDEHDLHDPLVEARPDLFTTDPPQKSKKSGSTPSPEGA